MTSYMEFMRCLALSMARRCRLTGHWSTPSICQCYCTAALLSTKAKSHSFNDSQIPCLLVTIFTYEIHLQLLRLTLRNNFSRHNTIICKFNPSLGMFTIVRHRKPNFNFQFRCLPASAGIE